MGEASRDEYKIQSFDAETQQLLKTALKGEPTGPSTWARAAEGLAECPASLCLPESKSQPHSWTGRRAPSRPLFLRMNHSPV